MSTGRRANARRRIHIKEFPLPKLLIRNAKHRGENTHATQAVTRGGTSTLVIDPSTPAMFVDSSASTGTTVASNSFTPPNKALVAVLFANGGSGASGASGTALSDSSEELSFSKVVDVEDASAGACSIWLAQCPVSPGLITVEMTFPSAVQAGHYILPVVITGASVASPSAWPGATATADHAAAAAAVMGDMSPNFSSSFILGIFEDFGVQTAPTLLSATTDKLNGITQFASSASPASGVFAAQYTGQVKSKQNIHNAFGVSAPSSKNVACAIEIPKVS